MPANISVLFYRDALSSLVQNIGGNMPPNLNVKKTATTEPSTKLILPTVKVRIGE